MLRVVHFNTRIFDQRHDREFSFFVGATPFEQEVTPEEAAGTAASMRHLQCNELWSANTALCLS